MNCEFNQNHSHLSNVSLLNSVAVGITVDVLGVKEKETSVWDNVGWSACTMESVEVLGGDEFGDVLGVLRKCSSTVHFGALNGGLKETWCGVYSLLPLKSTFLLLATLYISISPPIVQIFN